MAHRRIAGSGLLALTLLSLLAACSGGSSGDSASNGAPPSGSGPTQETIQGVATPSSVSVVTATNAS
jgi:hypothetical protein